MGEFGKYQDKAELNYQHKLVWTSLLLKNKICLILTIKWEQTPTRRWNSKIAHFVAAVAAVTTAAFLPTVMAAFLLTITVVKTILVAID